MDNAVTTSDSPEAAIDVPLIDCDDSSTTADDSQLLSDGHLEELDSAHPQHRLSLNEANPVSGRCPISVKKRFLIGCFLGSSITILAMISIGFVLSKKLSQNSDTTTTTETTLLNQSSTTFATTNFPTSRSSTSESKISYKKPTIMSF